FSMGKYLTWRGMTVTGYYSRSPESANEAAGFTGTNMYTDIGCLVTDSDAVFITVPDGAIADVWEEIRGLPIQGKIMIHCSGSLSSTVFSGIEDAGGFAYSIHPLLAVNDKYSSYDMLAKAFFTIEGSPEHLDDLKKMFEGFGNHVEIINAEDKTLYHAAAAAASNLAVGLVAMSEEMLMRCGFGSQSAHEALSPLIMGNMVNIVEAGTRAALTGPVERNDAGTVGQHLKVLSGDEATVYRLLSAEIVKLAEEKYPERDYTKLKEELGV
ncbi:MAG: DUF2520 domain-containing protein, partial [Clostridiales bacterium]|nr:DUF2520 domain-containing protein [Clostridiales bacterium]